MLFNSLVFLLFFPTVCVLYYSIPSSLTRARNLLLLVASYYFYMNWQPSYALLLLTSTVVTYIAALAMAHVHGMGAKRWCLASSLFINIALLPILFTIARDSDSALEERACANENQNSCAERFVSLCHNQGIFLVFTVSPELTVIDSDYYAQWQSIADRRHVPMLNYHAQQLFTDHPEYFHDNVHLWDRGARAFSPIFAHDLKALCSSHHSQ